MRLTKQTGHAIRILAACARASDALIKAADLGRDLAISKQNVFKIVHLLSRAGFLKATRGPTGGIELARPAHEIRIGDVVRAMEQTSVDIGPEARGFGVRSEHSDAALQSVFGDALTAFISVLDQHTLSDLAGPPHAAATQARPARRQ